MSLVTGGRARSRCGAGRKRWGRGRWGPRVPGTALGAATSALSSRLLHALPDSWSSNRHGVLLLEVSFFFFKCNAPRFPLATCRWSQAQGPSRCSALRDPLCSEARPCGFRAAAHHGPCCVPSACCRVPPSSPAALPRFPLPPVPPAMALLRAPAPSSAQPPRRARGSQRAGSGRPQLGSHPDLSPGAGRREPVLRSSAARRRSRGINCTSSSNKTLKAAAGASSSRLCPDSLVRGSSRGPWGC